jgi:hypothetical protein
MVADFFDGVREAWWRNWVRAAAGLTGAGLFLWSAAPIATM